MTKKRLLRFSPYLTFLFCYGLVTIVGLIPGLLYGNEMGYWLLGFWFILPWSALLCTFFAAFLRLPLYIRQYLFTDLWHSVRLRPHRFPLILLILLTLQIRREKKWKR